MNLSRRSFLTAFNKCVALAACPATMALNVPLNETLETHKGGTHYYMDVDSGSDANNGRAWFVDNKGKVNNSGESWDESTTYDSAMERMKAGDTAWLQNAALPASNVFNKGTITNPIKIIGCNNIN